MNQILDIFFYSSSILVKCVQSVQYELVRWGNFTYSQNPSGFSFFMQIRALFFKRHWDYQIFMKDKSK